MTSWVHRHALGDQQLMQPALGPGVVTDDKAEAAGGALLGHRLADDHLEVRRPIGPAAHIAAVDADRHRRAGDRHRVPFGLAAGGEHRLLGAEFGLQALGHAQDIIPDRRGIHRHADRQHIGNQRCGDTIAAR